MAATHLVFDVNETLLDLSPLDDVFADLFGDAAMRGVWFQRLLHWSTVTTLTGEFMDFGVLAGHCLDQLADMHDVALADDQRARVFDTIGTLSPHGDVVAALEKLKSAGFSLTALTNSAQKTVNAQFANAELTPLFDHVLSVDTARCYKPHPDAYDVAVDALGATPDQLRLVAAHDWDVTGAMRAGLKAAFVARGKATLSPAGERPDIVGKDLADVAQQIIAVDGA